MIVFLAMTSASAATFSDEAQADFEAGTHDQTEWSSGAVRPVPDPWTWESARPGLPVVPGGVGFGRAMVALPDLDGNGVADLAVGFPSEQGKGVVRIWLMGPDGAVLAERVVADGVGGLALAAGDRFGAALAPLGDLDGDGSQELAVGLPGAAQVVRLSLDTGGNATLSTTWDAGSIGEEGGSALASLGDLNGDGRIALAVGIPQRGASAGEVRLWTFDAAAGRTDQSLASGASGESLGAALAGLGDLDGDGVGDLAMARPGIEEVTLLRVDSAGGALGSTTLLGSVFTSGEDFGIALCGLGDLDGLGGADLVVGTLADDDGVDSGAVWLLSLDAAGAVATTTRIDGDEGGFQGVLGAGTRFGQSLASWPDIDGDGRPEIVVGATERLWLLQLDAAHTVKTPRSRAAQFTSRMLDASVPHRFETASWNAVLDEGSVTVGVRTCVDAACAGTPFIPVASTPASLSLPVRALVQYQLDLITDPWSDAGAQWISASFEGCPDADLDGFCEGVDDLCPGFDDTLDGDLDGVPDGCDLCLGPDSLGDPDGDGICGSCFGNPFSGDADDDGLCADFELALGLSDDDPDFDDDGLGDADEALILGTDPASADSDGDLLSDGLEVAGSTDPLDDDTDDDGLLDGTEDADADGLVSGSETDPTQSDTDGDGLLDGLELGLVLPQGGGTAGFVPDADPLSTTDPIRPDTDGDGLLDGEEDADGDGLRSLAETDPADDDTDDDGLLDDEASRTPPSNPLLADSDGDGISDGIEGGLTEPEGSGTAGFVPDADPSSTTDPSLADTDGGGAPDGAEDFNRDGAVQAGECDPTDPADDAECEDADGDGLSVSQELSLGTDPFDDDTDEDGLLDGTEVSLGTSPLSADSDSDFVDDGTELGLVEPQGADTNLAFFLPDLDPLTTTDPLDADTDGGGAQDGAEDSNGNGRVDAGERDPNDGTDDVQTAVDTDGDGVSDALELLSGTDPNDPDSDGDGVFDGVDGYADTDGDGVIDALDPDSDGDGLFDGLEDLDGDGVLDPGETDPKRPDALHGGACGCREAPSAPPLWPLSFVTRRRL